jgi:nitroreductase
MIDPLAAWSVREEERPRGDARAQLEYLIRYAILAPSTHNSQPWRFRVRDDQAIEVWSDATRLLERLDPDRRQLFMSCGAALANLRVAMRRFGNIDLVEYLPSPQRPDWLATVFLGPEHAVSERDQRLCAAIPRRRTNCNPFLERPVSEELAEQILAAVSQPGTWMVRLHPHAKLEIADAVARADREQLADPRFRAELAEWLTPRGSRRADGVPMERTDLPTALPLAASMIVRHVDLGDRTAVRDEARATRSPMLTVLGTTEDTPLAWLLAGESMQEALLTAAELGLSTSFLNQAIEEPGLRRKVAEAAGHEGLPQLIMRWGYGPTITPTPRRPLPEVLM